MDIQELEMKLERTYSFKYRPRFMESFRTELKENQVIPLILAVFEQLDWPMVYRDHNSVEAKRKGDWNRLTEKLTILKKASGRIVVHSKSLNGHFMDFGRNSLNVRLFISVFQQLAIEYQENGKLVELTDEFEAIANWRDYEIPSELPKPKIYEPPNLAVAIVGGMVSALVFGMLIALLSSNFSYYVGIYELLIGLGVAFVFGKVLKHANYTNFKIVQWLVGLMMVVLWVTNLYMQYQLSLWEYKVGGTGFWLYLKLRYGLGLTLDNMHLGKVGLIVFWLFQMVFPYFIIIAKVAGTLANFMVGKVPGTVLEFVAFLFHQGKTESEVRSELAQLGWHRKPDQDMAFEALAEIHGYHEANRE